MFQAMPDTTPTRHAPILFVLQVEAIAAHFQLRKSPKDSKVFVPVYGAPCAYEELADFEVRCDVSRGLGCLNAQIYTCRATLGQRLQTQHGI